MLFCTDIRTQKLFEGRSINLSLSTRGREALEVAGVAGSVSYSMCFEINCASLRLQMCDNVYYY